MVPSDFKGKNPDFDEVYRAQIKILTKFIEPIATTLGLFPRWESLPVGGVSPLGESPRWGSLPVGGVSPLGESPRWGSLPVGRVSPLGYIYIYI